MVLCGQRRPRRKAIRRDGSRHGQHAGTTEQLCDNTVENRRILDYGIPLVGAVSLRPRHGWESGKYRRDSQQKHYQLQTEQSGAADEVVEGARRHSWDRMQSTVRIAAGSDDLGGGHDADIDLVGWMGGCRGDNVGPDMPAVGVGSQFGENCYLYDEILEDRADDAGGGPMIDEAADRGWGGTRTQ